MAVLSQSEFDRSMVLLAQELGLQRLSDKFFKYRGLVTRRGFKSAEQLGTHVYTLSGGLRRQVAVNVAYHAIWAEMINNKLGEERAEALEKLADGVNACLDESEQIIADKSDAIDQALLEYQKALADAVGAEMARLDMLMKAVPQVAERLRAAAPAAE